jgi:hypothetical protein
MELSEIIQRIRSAKSAHLGWVNRARSLINGRPVDHEKIPVMSTDCAFGSWYYGDGKPLSELESYKAIETPHNELHEIYAEIFDLLFEKTKPGFMDRITGGYKRRKAEKILTAQARFHDLQQSSNVIITRLGSLERELRHLPKAELANLFK